MSSDKGHQVKTNQKIMNKMFYFEFIQFFFNNFPTWNVLILART